MLTDNKNGDKLMCFCDGDNVLMTKEKPDDCTSWRTKQVYTIMQAPGGQIISERPNTA